jgi:hypothetical protein
MPDVAAMVPELEIDKHVSTICVSNIKKAVVPKYHIFNYDGYELDTAIISVLAADTHEMCVKQSPRVRLHRPRV